RCDLLERQRGNLLQDAGDVGLQQIDIRRDRRKFDHSRLAANQIDRGVRVEVEVDTRLTCHKRLDHQLTPQTALYQGFEILNVVRATDDLNFVQLDLDVDGNL